MKLVFVSGPYRSETYEGRQANIERAKEAAIKIWQSGDIAFCPHLNTMNFDGLVPDDTFLAGDIEILGRCDIIYMLNGWQDSAGSRAEYQYAIEHRLEVMTE